MKATELKTTRIVCGGLFNVTVCSDKQSLYSWGCNDESGLVRKDEDCQG